MRMDRPAAAMLAVACALGIAWLSRVQVLRAEPDRALLRLSWRVLGARIEECRPRTAEELEALAPHMRTPETCVGRNADYALHVEIDGAIAVADTLSPAGVRGDRPVYVLEDISVAPGSHDVRVGFAALVPGETPDQEAEEAEEPRAELEGREDARRDLEWSGTVTVGPGEIALITMDPSGSALVLGGPQPR